MNAGIADSYEKKHTAFVAGGAAVDRLVASQRALSKAVLSDDQVRLFQAVVDQAGQLLGAPRCELYLWDDDQRLRFCGASSGSTQEARYGERVARVVAKAEHPVLVDHYDLWQYPVSTGEGSLFCSALAFPIGSDPGPYAVLTVLSSIPDAFSSAHIQLLNLFSAQVMSALRSWDDKETLSCRTSLLHQIEDELLSDLSHDLRGSLASIRAYTELLMDEVDGGNPETRHFFLEVIDQKARYLTDVITNLTTVLRSELGYLRPHKSRVSLPEVISEVAVNFRAQACQRGIELRVESSERLPPLWADREMMSMLLNVLIDNALKFSESGGEVVISVRSAGADQILTVMDQGIGVDLGDPPRVSGAFHRGRGGVERQIEGIGLGLAVAGAIVEAHSGSIEVAREEGRGTRLTVTLPSDDRSADRL